MNSVNRISDADTNTSGPANNPLRDHASSETAPFRPSVRTLFAFALVTALGGLLVGTGGDTGPFGMIVVLFAVIGFVLVDWLKLFALPSLVAYAAMALTAVICVADFVEESGQVGQKMVAVAQLLAIAQGILMLQEKSHRLFEQLLIFALLNAVVAAVFNDAFNYAVYFIPLMFACGWALSCLASDQAIEHGERVAQASENGSQSEAEPSREPASSLYQWSNKTATQSLRRVGRRVAWGTVVVTFPAVVALSCVFFFALPRRVDARRGSASQTIVGFSEQVSLKQIGAMQTTTQKALRVKLTDPDTGNPYPVISGLYLRGRVLEVYQSDTDVVESQSNWRSVVGVRMSSRRSLPPRFVPEHPSESRLFDRVHVNVTCEAMRSPSLFALSPYHRIIGSQNVEHFPTQWTICRKGVNLGSKARKYPRIHYDFGSTAFRNGIQNEWICHRPIPESRRVSDGGDARARTEPGPQQRLSGKDLDYFDILMEYPEQTVPSARMLADEIISKMPPSKRSPGWVALEMSRQLATDSDFTYTLDLSAEAIDGMDPLEQFISEDRRGHCQFFASALVMMLRSQDIPARLVVGYHCDEFNELGQFFDVRQSHAHAWVEALIDRKDVPPGNNLGGQPRSDRYWLRLDPTPGGGGSPNMTSAGGTQAVDLARSYWNDYVIEMDPSRQRSTLLATPGIAPMTASYESWIAQAKDLAIRINAGEIRGLGGGRLFSLSGAAGAIAILSIAFMVLRLRFPGWLKSRLRIGKQARAPAPTIPFYAETLELLQSFGLSRRSGQTPIELTGQLEDDELKPPVTMLTDTFYQIRYGGSENLPESTIESALQRIRAHMRNRKS